MLAKKCVVSTHSKQLAQPIRSLSDLCTLAAQTLAVAVVFAVLALAGAGSVGMTGSTVAEHPQETASGFFAAELLPSVLCMSCQVCARAQAGALWSTKGPHQNALRSAGIVAKRFHC